MFLRETLYEHALERLKAARSEKNGEKKDFFPQKRLTIVDLFEGVWIGRDLSLIHI